MARVLVVDDEKSIRFTLSEMLRREGYDVEAAEDADEALRRLAEKSADVIVTDIILPRMNGVQLLKAVRRFDPYVQVIMMTGEPTVETAAETLRAGASDYLMKPVTKEAILRSVRHAAEIKVLDDERRRLSEENKRYQEDLEHRVEDRTRALMESNQRLQETIERTVEIVALTVETRDPYTAGHQKRVAEIARAIALEMKLTEDVTKGIFMAGLIHDLGKIGVPAEILSKPKALSEAEFTLIRTHPQVGYDILKTIAFPWPLAEIILQHHERLDGSGYPRGLAGDAVLIEARILGVADVVEAMASHRPYRPALGIQAALEEIRRKKGTVYDPRVVEACQKIVGHFDFRP